jgi:hypothetical protein
VPRAPPVVSLQDLNVVNAFTYQLDARRARGPGRRAGAPQAQYHGK